MARPNLKAVSVYLSEQQARILAAAAALEHRSVSNYLLANSLARAEEMGVKVMSADRETPADKKRKTIRRARSA